jgi:hypothetical protein
MLDILDINNFIKTNNVKCVSNGKSFNFTRINGELTKENTIDGLHSKVIFGEDSVEQYKTFGYINLKGVFIHPLLFKMLIKLNSDFKKILMDSTDFKIVDGNLLLLEDKTQNPISKVALLFDKIAFEKMANNKRKNKIVKTIKSYKKEELFINKFIVVPPGFRPFIENDGRVAEDEFDVEYKKLLNKHNRSQIYIQSTINTIHNKITGLLKSKNGIIRGNVIGKRTNHNTRLVANALPEIPISAVGIPWQNLIVMYDVFLYGYFLNDPTGQEISEKLALPSVMNLFGEELDFISRNVEVYLSQNPTHKELWIKALVNILDNNPSFRVLLKRDPAWDAKSFHSLKPFIINDGYNVVVNSIIYSPIGGDSFNTNFTSYKTKSNILSDKNTKITSETSSVSWVSTFKTIVDKRIP